MGTPHGYLQQQAVCLTGGPDDHALVFHRSIKISAATAADIPFFRFVNDCIIYYMMIENTRATSSTPVRFINK